MNIRHRFLQIRKLTPWNLSRAVARRATSAARAATERFLYTPTGPRRPTPVRPVRLLNLLHPDVLSPEFAARFKAAFPDHARRIIDAGSNARDLVINLLGSGPVDLKAFRDRGDLRLYPGDAVSAAGNLAKGGLVPWHFDFKAGVGWPADTFFSQIRWGARGVDIKVPWELSRAQHFVTLGQAYALTGDESYTKAFCDQLEDWIRRNPPKYGVNWACAMDVGLRACNWLLAWEFFERSAHVSDFVRKNLGASLWEHGHHIMDHLEWGGEISSNHYLSDLLGLAYISRALNEPKWSDFAWSEMHVEIKRQIREDGFDYEASTAYHRLVLEIFVYLILSAPSEEGSERACRPLLDRIRLMGQALAGLTDTHGRIPLIGDNDSGHVHNLLERTDADVSYVLDLTALLVGDPTLRPAGPPSSEPAWFFGIESALVRPAPATGRTSLSPGETGIASLRGSSDTLVFSAQPNGTRGIGNHTHNDKLSFCLTVGRDAFLADPGTFVYTSLPEDRNAFRRTSAHTTVAVDNEEQNRIFPDQMFVLGDDARSRISQYTSGSRVSGEHDGYSRLPDPVVHRRSIERIAMPLSWIIEDDLTGAAEHDLRWTFIGGPGIRAIVDAPGLVRLVGQDGELEISAHPATLKFNVEKGRLAPVYGVAVDSVVVTTEWKGKLPFHATFTAVWRSKAGEK